MKNKKVKRLMFDDVSVLGYELSLKLRGRRIPLEDAIVSHLADFIRIHDLYISQCLSANDINWNRSYWRNMDQRFQ